MTEKKRAKKGKRTRQERRYEPEQTQTSTLLAGLGFLGSALLGGGVYSQWVSETPWRFAYLLVGAGALLLAATLWFGDAGVVPVRVGDAGVAIERGNEQVRLGWYQMDSITASAQSLAVSGKGRRLEIPLAPHRRAAAAILAEAARRVPKVLDVKASVAEGLPKPSDSAGEVLAVEVQIAGERCAATSKIITLEREARLCPSCGQIYARGSVPARCITCDAELGSLAIEVGS